MCGNLKIDGGKEFRHRIFKDDDKWEELSEMSEE